MGAEFGGKFEDVGWGGMSSEALEGLSMGEVKMHDNDRVVAVVEGQWRECG